ncbi:MAG: FkbM family methyltransferase [Flavobacteriaceae bacterium]|nr:FkbM family methyltransferase [Flavobacteriaceae bacterium]
MRLNTEFRKIKKNEFDDLEFLYSKLEEKPTVIFDCGANIGFVSYQFYKRFPSSHIYAFEPNPDIFSKLHKNTRKEQIKTFQVGVGNSESKIEFYKNNNSGTSSFFEPNEFHLANLARKYKKVKVPVISIDSFCVKNSINEISILKLDIEGYELKALEGCEKMLEKKKIDFILTEVSLVPVYKDQSLIEDIIKYLRNYNYVLFNFYGNNETKLRESLLTNLLFVSEKTAEKLEAKLGRNSIFTYKK